MHAGRQDYINVLDSNYIYSEVHSFENAPHSFRLFNPWFEPTVKYMDRFLKKVFYKNDLGFVDFDWFRVEALAK